MKSKFKEGDRVLVYRKDINMPGPWISDLDRLVGETLTINHAITKNTYAVKENPWTWGDTVLRKVGEKVKIKKKKRLFGFLCKATGNLYTYSDMNLALQESRMDCEDLSGDEVDFSCNPLGLEDNVIYEFKAVKPEGIKKCPCGHSYIPVKKTVKRKKKGKKK